MPEIVFHQPGGRVATVETEAGVSVMRAAVQNAVEGIVGECGGQAMCATCHVLVHESVLDGLPPIGDDEEEMLDCTAAPRDPRRSRLGCQLIMGTDLPKVAVDVPETQL
ncbi:MULTISPECIES: 2Fe-2S iron-sulfur cluster-binding protein [Prauserella salsuginis group]|uniref:2Fe-2S iron-sulfur cluster-binding protein n=1 Tax=Prauserella salsuginis TaxID=387889 RepID=A0ABW6G0V6_9PSEU|nr:MULTISPECIES: 2Fe-2S iron-sulfur cluster-binding protein [Prauserella salsuginis group]MCR3721985.1 ferredoxin, 2Fe-2S [Prauserella flava]MCR3735991.1 ferredoxin, 2Fe-2S [Prauserella salsuginis]